jgi:hypothetical protein
MMTANTTTANTTTTLSTESYSSLVNSFINESKKITMCNFCNKESKNIVLACCVPDLTGGEAGVDENVRRNDFRFACQTNQFNGCHTMCIDCFRANVHFQKARESKQPGPLRCGLCTEEVDKGTRNRNYKGRPVERCIPVDAVKGAIDLFAGIESAKEEVEANEKAREDAANPESGLNLREASAAPRREAREAREEIERQADAERTEEERERIRADLEAERQRNEDLNREIDLANQRTQEANDTAQRAADALAAAEERRSAAEAKAAAQAAAQAAANLAANAAANAAPMLVTRANPARNPARNPRRIPSTGTGVGTGADPNYESDSSSSSSSDDEDESEAPIARRQRTQAPNRAQNPRARRPHQPRPEVPSSDASAVKQRGRTTANQAKFKELATLAVRDGSAPIPMKGKTYGPAIIDDVLKSLVEWREDVKKRDRETFENNQRASAQIVNLQKATLLAVRELMTVNKDKYTKEYLIQLGILPSSAATAATAAPVAAPVADPVVAAAAAGEADRSSFDD